MQQACRQYFVYRRCQSYIWRTRITENLSFQKFTICNIMIAFIRTVLWACSTALSFPMDPLSLLISCWGKFSILIFTFRNFFSLEILHFSILSCNRYSLVLLFFKRWRYLMWFGFWLKFKTQYRNVSCSALVQGMVGGTKDFNANGLSFCSDGGQLNTVLQRHKEVVQPHHLQTAVPCRSLNYVFPWYVRSSALWELIGNNYWDTLHF